MNNWLVYALFSPFVYTVVNFIDKYLIEEKVKDYKGMPIYAAIMGGLMGSFFWLVTGLKILPFYDATLILLSGMLQIFGTALYFQAISKSETSKLILFFQMLPIFVLIFSFIFLKEVITFKQIIGFILLFGASIALSYEKDDTHFKLSSSFYLILLVDVLWAASAVLMKFTIHASEFVHVLSYESWGIGLGGLVLFVFFPQVRESFLKVQRSLPKNVLTIMFANEGLYVLAKSLAFYAYLIGPVSLVSVLSGSFQVFLGILLGGALTLLLPRVFKEDISKKTLMIKLLFGVVLCVGMWFVY